MLTGLVSLVVASRWVEAMLAAFRELPVAGVQGRFTTDPCATSTLHEVAHSSN